MIPCIASQTKFLLKVIKNEKPNNSRCRHFFLFKMAPKNVPAITDLYPNRILKNPQRHNQLKERTETTIIHLFSDKTLFSPLTICIVRYPGSLVMDKVFKNSAFLSKLTECFCRFS